MFSILNRSLQNRSSLWSGAVSFNTKLLIMLPPISDVGGIASQSEAIVPQKPQLKSHLCASCGCAVRTSDLKAVGEDTVGGPVPGSLEAFTAVYLKYLYV